MSKRKVSIVRELEEDMVGNGVENGSETKEQIIAEYNAMANQAGWRRMVGVLDRKIEAMTSEILDTDTQGEELNRLRDRRDLLLWFRNFPEIISKSFSQSVQPGIEDFDAYDKKPGIDIGSDLPVV